MEDQLADPSADKRARMRRLRAPSSMSFAVKYAICTTACGILLAGFWLFVAIMR
jgi:hypothetical protein